MKPGSTPPTSTPENGHGESVAPKTTTLMFSWMEDPDAAPNMPWAEDLERWAVEMLNQRRGPVQTQQPAAAETRQPVPLRADPPTRT